METVNEFQYQQDVHAAQEKLGVKAMDVVNQIRHMLDDHREGMASHVQVVEAVMIAVGGKQ